MRMKDCNAYGGEHRSQPDTERKDKKQTERDAVKCDSA